MPSKRGGASHGARRARPAAKKAARPPQKRQRRATNRLREMDMDEDDDEDDGSLARQIQEDDDESADGADEDRGPDDDDSGPDAGDEAPARKTRRKGRAVREESESEACEEAEEPVRKSRRQKAEAGPSGSASEARRQPRNGKAAQGKARATEEDEDGGLELPPGWKCRRVDEGDGTRLIWLDPKAHKFETREKAEAAIQRWSERQAETAEAEEAPTPLAVVRPQRPSARNAKERLAHELDGESWATHRVEEGLGRGAKRKTREEERKIPLCCRWLECALCPGCGGRAVHRPAGSKGSGRSYVPQSTASVAWRLAVASEARLRPPQS